MCRTWKKKNWKAGSEGFGSFLEGRKVVGRTGNMTGGVRCWGGGVSKIKELETCGRIWDSNRPTCKKQSGLLGRYTGRKLYGFRENQSSSHRGKRGQKNRNETRLRNTPTHVAEFWATVGKNIPMSAGSHNSEGFGGGALDDCAT